MKRLWLSLALCWIGCGGNSNFVLTIVYPDDLARQQATTLRVVSILAESGGNCEALLTEAATPGDDADPIETELSIDMKDGIKMPDLNLPQSGNRLFYLEAQGGSGPPWLHGCSEVNAGSGEAHQVTINLTWVGQADLSASSIAASKTIVSPEEKIGLTLTIKNTGRIPAFQPKIVGAIPQGSDFVAGSTTGDGVYNQADRNVIWIGSEPLSAGAEHSISFQVAVGPNTPPGTQLASSALFVDLAREQSFNASADVPVVSWPDVELVSSADTYIDNWYQDTNYGADGEVRVRSPDIFAVLIRFDTSGIPIGSVIKRAELALFCTTRTNPGTMDIDVYQMIQPWDEATATWKLAAAQTPWGVAGAKGPGDRSNTILATFKVEQTNVFYKLDVTSLAQKWADGETNAGLLMMSNSAGSVYYEFVSKDSWDSIKRPKLTVQYVNP